MGYLQEPVLIPNAVNTQHFSQTFSTKALEEAASELGKTAGNVYMVTTSRLVHKNGIDDVIRALALLPAHVQFVVYGGGPDEAMLKALATKLGVADRVHFNGLIGHDAMPLYLQACDIFIHR